MNLRQLQYITALLRNKLNGSATADSLYTSRPGVSKQVRQLEDELGLQLFERTGRQLTRVAAAGERIVALALAEVEGIRELAREETAPDSGRLSIATTHTLARYALPN